MAHKEYLITIRDQLTAIIISITADPKPTYNIDGQSVSWNDYLDKLTNQLSKYNELINQEDPYEYETQVWSC